MKLCVLAAICCTTNAAFALDASDFSGMEGWSIVATTAVRGDFEGCDHDKRIRFDNGWTLTCREYSYSYAFQPEAVIFAKPFEFKGRNYWMIKALIEDELYEMEPIPAKLTRPR